MLVVVLLSWWRCRSTLDILPACSAQCSLLLQRVTCIVRTVFTGRQHSLRCRPISYGPSVRPSVRLSHAVTLSKQDNQALLKAKYCPRVAAALCTQKQTLTFDLWPRNSIGFVPLWMYMLLQNFIKLRASVYELSWSQRKKTQRTQ